MTVYVPVSLVLELEIPPLIATLMANNVMWVSLGQASSRECSTYKNAVHVATDTSSADMTTKSLLAEARSQLDKTLSKLVEQALNDQARKEASSK